MSAKAADYHKRLTEFMVEKVFPAEKSYDEYRAAAGPNDFTVPPVLSTRGQSTWRRRFEVKCTVAMAKAYHGRMALTNTCRLPISWPPVVA